VSQKNKIVIISDFFKQDYINVGHPIGGAELNDDVLFTHLENLGLVTHKIHTNENPEPEMLNFFSENRDKLFLISNFANLSFKCLVYLAFNCKYVIYEHDYKFHKYRNPIRYKDFLVPEEEVINYNFFNKAKKVICLSKLHYDIFKNNLGLTNLHNTTCSLWAEEDLLFIETLLETPKDKKCAIVNSPNPIKRTEECENFCKENNLKYDLISSPEYHEFLRFLSKYETFVALPGHPEPTPRVIVEAKMLGCKILSNKKTVGVFYEDWFSLNGKELIDKLREIRKKTLDYITGVCGE